MYARVLTEARDILKDTYYQGNPPPRKHCALTALGRALDVAEFGRGQSRLGSKPVTYLRQASQELFDGKLIVKISDELGYGAVMQLYDRAIEIAEGDQNEQSTD